MSVRQLTADKMENAVVELERRRLTRNEALKAARAMEALDVKKPAAVNDAHVKLIVSALPTLRYICICMTRGSVKMDVAELSLPKILAHTRSRSSAWTAPRRRRRSPLRRAT